MKYDSSYHLEGAPISTAARGKWTIDIYKAASSDLFVTFVATANAAWNDAAQNGHRLQIDNLGKVAIQEIVAALPGWTITTN